MVNLNTVLSFCNTTSTFCTFISKYYKWILVIVILIFIYYIYKRTTSSPSSSENPSKSLFQYIKANTDIYFPYLFDSDDINKTNNIEKKSKKSSGEQMCKQILEEYFDKPFISIRPTFLKNQVTDSNLELYCYNEELNLALEFNGKQHYEYTPHFHKTRDTFHNLKYRDILKKQMCEKNNVNLIVVPYYEADNYKKLKQYLINKLKSLGY